MQALRLQQRALHFVAECHRVEAFVAACSEVSAVGALSRADAGAVGVVVVFN